MMMEMERQSGNAGHDFHVTAWLASSRVWKSMRVELGASVRPRPSASDFPQVHNQPSPRDLNTPDAICLKTKRGKINGREYLKLSEFRAISSSSSSFFSSSSSSYEKHRKFPRTTDDGRRIHGEGRGVSK